MRYNLLATGAALLALFGSEVRAASFNLTFSTGAAYYQSVFLGDYSPCPIVSAGLAACTLPYDGEVQVALSSDADGTYTDADVKKIVFSSTFDSFSYSYGDVPELETKKSGYEYVGMTLYPSVTVNDGRVSGMSFFYQFLFGRLDVEGLEFSDFDGGPYSSYTADGILTPVPELPTAALLIAGVGLFALRRRAQ